jgi:hypothetical protein
LPLIQTTSSGKGSGYSVMLYQKEIPYVQSENDPEEGWHIFVHPATDPWTGKKNKSTSIINSQALSVHNTFIRFAHIVSTLHEAAQDGEKRHLKIFLLGIFYFV